MIQVLSIVANLYVYIVAICSPNELPLLYVHFYSGLVNLCSNTRL